MNARQTAFHSFLLLLFVLLIPAFAAGRVATAFAQLDTDALHTEARVESTDFGGIPVAELHLKASARPVAVRPA